MTKNNIEAIYRLSPLQEGILYHCLKSAGTGVYFQQFSCTLAGLQEGARWEQAWAKVAQRHAIMRTLFTWEKRDQPLQIVRNQIELPWQHLDWRELTPGDREERWKSLLETDRSRNFDLSQAPLMRFTLVRQGQADYRFLWSFHHIVLDGWSQRLLLEEALGLCRAGAAGNQDTFQAAPTYANFISWLEHLDGDRAREFWTAQLEGFAQPTTLPFSTAGTARAGQKAVAEVVELELKPASIDKLVKQGQGQKLTLNSMVVGAWARVLGAHCGSDDIVFGVTVSGRPASLPGADRTAGLFINTLPCRVQLSADGSIGDWLRELQSDQVRLREFEQTPLVDIQRWSSLPAGQALFESIIVFENLPAGTATGLPDPQVQDQQYAEYSHYPLAILVDPSQGLKLIAVYQPTHFSTDGVNRLLAQLEFVLEQMCESLQVPVQSLSILPKQERDLMLLDWNHTQHSWPADYCVHQLFEQQAAENPDRKAVVCGSDALSYAELNARSNQLAHHLLAQGLGPDSLVPVFLERGIDALIAFLAVLKTGAAYIPLDSANPQAQLSNVLTDIPGDAAMVLTQASLVGQLPVSGCQPLCLDREHALLSSGPDHNPSRKFDSGTLAYVVYTSGSTGRPKGVMIEHGSLANSTQARFDFYEQQPSVFLLLSSLSADSSLAGLYWTLCSGATLVLADRRAEQDVERLGALIAKQQISHMLCVPSLYQLILEHGRAGQLSSLQAVIVAGEACGGEVVRQHQVSLPTARLFNEYGPSECTVWATVAELTQSDPSAVVSIGHPIANTCLYILDSQLRPVPVGAAGELFIGGPGVARGYLNQPAATALAFIDNPFAPRGKEESSRQLYKTGDRARYREDGAVEFLGRVDNQIKVRGYRVEPEQIEATLAAHPAVAEVVVFLEGDTALDSDGSRLLRRLESLGTEQAEIMLQKIEMQQIDVNGVDTDESAIEL